MTKKPPKLRYEPSSEPKPLRRLTRAVQKKVVLEIENGDEQNVCWLWTGAFKQPRQQALRLYSNHKTREANGGGRRGRPSSGTAGYYTKERGLPMMRVSGTSSVISAARIIYSEVYDIPIDEVPHMRRCMNDRCVSPYHLTPVGKMVRYTRYAAEEVQPPAPAPAPGAPAQAAPPVMSVDVDADAIIGRLVIANVSHQFDPHTACLQAGINPALMTPAIWEKFVAYMEARDAEYEDD